MRTVLRIERGRTPDPPCEEHPASSNPHGGAVMRGTVTAPGQDRLGAFEPHTVVRRGCYHRGTSICHLQR